jgi:hypothetical protein
MLSTDLSHLAESLRVAPTDAGRVLAAARLLDAMADEARELEGLAVPPGWRVPERAAAPEIRQSLRLVR